MFRNKHTEALTSLLATPDGYGSTGRPKEVTLPEAVHDSVVETVQETHADGRERKLGFRYMHDRWVSGIKRTGSSVRLLPNGKIVDPSVGRPLLCFRPAIHMHTHPTFDSDLMVKLIDSRAQAAGVDWDDAKKKELSDRGLRFLRGSHMLPSSHDIVAMHSISPGTVGNMIASSGGIFLAVRDLNEKEYLSPSKSMKNDIAPYEVLYRQVLQEGPPSLTVREVLLGATARVLNHKYTTYFGDNPDNPTLTRVDTN